VGATVHGSNSHDYRLIHYTAGISGTDRSVFKIWQSATVIDPETKIQDGMNLIWLDLGETRPLTTDEYKVLRWEQSTDYCKGSLIFVPGVGNGRYYQAQDCGKSGDFSPFLNLDPPYPVTWQDSGTTAPAPVAGGQPADQNVSLVNLTLPQAHSLSYFNIAAGVLVDFKKSPTFGFVPASSYGGTLPAGFNPGPIPAPTATVLGVDSKTGCTISGVAGSATAYVWECPIQTGTGATPVDPVLVLTGYIVPVDAERPFRYKGVGWWRDYLPAPSLGISLANPTTNFYLGASNEAFVRNLQFFYGVGFHSTSLRLASGASQPAWGGAGTPPTVATTSGFLKGFFFGATFNLSGFVQTLFGGGAKSQ